MRNSILKINPKDNVSIALTDLHKGEHLTYSDHVYVLTANVPAKPKRLRAASFELSQSCSGRMTSFPGRGASPSDEMPRLQPMG